MDVKRSHCISGSLFKSPDGGQRMGEDLVSEGIRHQCPLICNLPLDQKLDLISYFLNCYFIFEQNFLL